MYTGVFVLFQVSLIAGSIEDLPLQKHCQDQVTLLQQAVSLKWPAFFPSATDSISNPCPALSSASCAHEMNRIPA